MKLRLLLLGFCLLAGLHCFKVKGISPKTRNRDWGLLQLFTSFGWRIRGVRLKAVIVSNGCEAESLGLQAVQGATRGTSLLVATLCDDV